jgi:hypothetical protein
MQKANLYQPIHADRLGPAPLVIKAIVTPQADHMVGGVPSTTARIEPYVLLSALPLELRQRVELAVQTLIAGG